MRKPIFILSTIFLSMSAYSLSLNEYIYLTDRHDNALILDLICSYSFAEAADIADIIHRREDPFIGDIISGISGRTCRTRHEREYIILLMLDNPFYKYTDIKKDLFFKENRETIKELAENYRSFSDSDLRSAILRWMRFMEFREAVPVITDIGMFLLEQGGTDCEIEVFINTASLFRNSVLNDIVLLLWERSGSFKVNRAKAEYFSSKNNY